MTSVILSMLNDDIDHNKYVTNWKQSKWLVLSSTFFLFPCAYGFIQNLYILPIVLLFTSLISMNYWRHATYSYRRLIDRYFSKFAFLVFFVNGCMYIDSEQLRIIGYANTIGMVYCYYLSEKYGLLLENGIPNNSTWLKYHMLFHIFTTCNQTIVIYGIVENKKKNMICNEL